MLLEEPAGLFCHLYLADIPPLGTLAHERVFGGLHQSAINHERRPDSERPSGQNFSPRFHLNRRPLCSLSDVFVEPWRTLLETAAESFLFGEGAVRVLTVIAGECKVSEAMKPLSPDVGPVCAEHLAPLCP